LKDYSHRLRDRLRLKETIALNFFLVFENKNCPEAHKPSSKGRLSLSEYWVSNTGELAPADRTNGSKVTAVFSKEVRNCTGDRMESFPALFFSQSKYGEVFRTRRPHL
jgi:hypothetical protein